MPARTWRLAITGGIGSGKSTVARRLTERGAALIDADAIARDVTASGGAAMAQIIETFGPKLVTADGALDREAMRALAFTDEPARLALERIVHPLVTEQAASIEAAALGVGRACIVYDIPLLTGSSIWRRRVDHILVIDCPTNTQIQRVMARSQLARAEVESIVAAQATRQQRLRCADSVLYNDQQPITDLLQSVDQLAGHFGL